MTAKKADEQQAKERSVVDQAFAERRSLTAEEKAGLGAAELERYRRDHPGTQLQRAVMHQIPSVGRVVLFSGGGEDGNSEAAIVTKGSAQHDGRVSLLVLGELSTHRALDIPYSEVGVSNSWCWPPHVDDVVTYEPCEPSPVDDENNVTRELTRRAESPE